MKFFPSWWRKNFLIAELGVAASTLLALLLWWHFGAGKDSLAEIVHGNRAPIYGTLASIFGSLLGFVITSLSVVLTFSTSERLSVLKQSKYYPQIWKVFTSAIRWLGASTVAWLIALFLDKESSPEPHCLLACIPVAVLAIFRLIRCGWVLERMVETLTAQPHQSDLSSENR